MSIKKIAILVIIGVGALTTAIVVPIVVLSNKEDQKDPPKNIKIQEMQASLNNLNLILPKGKDYSDETKILRAIKTALENRTNIDASHTTFITSKTLANNKISLVAIHNATPTLFTIVVGGEEFILKLNQAQYTLDEISKINMLKASLSNLNVTLPKNGNYSNETQIFKAIKIRLETRDSIDASHIAFAISKTSANSKISSVAAHGASPTQFIIIVGDQEFILKLNQAQHNSNQINELKASLSNLELILPKGKDYSSESNIFETIKVALKTRVGIDDSHIAFITSKTLANSGITSIAAHGAKSTLFTIIIAKKEFILRLNQAQYDANEIAKINELKGSLDNLNVALPKGGNYNNESNIFEAIKVALKTRVGIDDSHIVFITSKTLANNAISSVASYGATSTLFTAIVDGEEFILQLNQAQYNAIEKAKIGELKNSLNNLKVTLPKGGNYNNESNIFEAIKVALKTRVGIDDSHIAFITSKPLANSGISLVAAHGVTSTLFTAIVDGKEFILKLNQAQYDANEKAKINELKGSLDNLKITLPKGQDYSNESNIFEAIKVALKTRVGIDDSHIAFITSKTLANNAISAVASYGATSTLFTAIVDGKEFILELNQVQYTLEEIKINKMQTSLSDLNLIFPNDGDYGDETKILEAIKIVLQKREGIDASHTTFITSKTSDNSGISSIATHEETPTPFTINVGDQEFVLKLKLSPFTSEQIKINELKGSLDNLKITLPKGEDYTSESNIFEVIKVALKARVGIDDSHLDFITSKPLANNTISEVASYGATSTLFIVIVDGEEFILKLNQAQYDANEIAKINGLKNSLNNLKVTLPKGEDYTSESNIFEVIKVALKARVGIDDSHLDFITSKPLANNTISEVASYGATSTLFIVIVDGEEFILKLNQAQYDANEIAKINELKNSLNNLKLTLPKGEDYTSESNIFEAIKVALKARVGIDDSHLDFITSKPLANNTISEVASYGATSTLFIVIVDGEEFILKLNQAQYDANEIAKINGLKNSLNNLKVTFPKGEDYTSESNIFEAIKVALKARVGIDDSHLDFITSKPLANNTISAVASYGATSTLFIVIVDGEEFILKLNQAQYDANEITKINELKNSLNNLKVTLPKGEDYTSESNIFEAIKVALKKRDGIDDSHLDFITSKPLANNTISAVAAYEATSTLFIVIVDGEEFILKLNQAQYDANEITKINELKNSLSDLKVNLPKGGDYTSESNIFEAIKVALKKRVGIDDSHLDFITPKPLANNTISVVAVYEATSTLFIVIVDGEEFILKLNQAQYDANEITKINELKNSLSDLKVNLPKGGDYTSESNIFEAIKVALKARDGIDDSHLGFMTPKPLANNIISAVAVYEATSTLFIVIVDGEEFNLKLNQAQYDANEITKINELKNSLSDLKVDLPKGGDYTSESNIFEAIKVALKARDGIDDLHLGFMTPKPSANSGIASVAVYEATSTSFIVIVDGEEFNLQLNQAQYDANEITKINELKNSLSDLKVNFPKGEDYTSEYFILEIIKVALKKRDGIDDSHLDFMIPKPSANSGITSVAAHGESPTLFTIFVDDEEFILQLNQSQFDLDQENKINEFKLDLDNSNIILLKAENYNDQFQILQAIKNIFRKRINDNYLYINFITSITSKTSANSGIASVAAHGESPTQFIIIVDGKEFVLQLNQSQYTLSEMTKIIEMQNTINYSNKIIVPKDEDYSSESLILEAIKTALKKRDDIDDSHIPFINSKTIANSGITSVAAHGESPTQFTILFIDQEFVLQLNQSEKTKISELKENLNWNLLTIPKGDNYSTPSLIFEAVKTALKKRDDIDDSHIPFITSKASANGGVSSVAAFGDMGTDFVVIVDGEEFILALNQDQITLEEIRIRDLLKNIGDYLYLYLPKGEDYSSESLILEAVKTALKKRSGIDDSHLILIDSITSKPSANSGIASVASFREIATQFTIIFAEKEFILNLNQENYTILEKFKKINEVKKVIRSNLTWTIPKDKKYDDAFLVYLDFKSYIIDKYKHISDNDFISLTTIIKLSSLSIAAHGEPPTLFTVAIGGEYFDLQLNQAE